MRRDPTQGLSSFVLLPLGAAVCGWLIVLAADAGGSTAARTLAALGAAAYALLATRSLAREFRDAWH